MCRLSDKYEEGDVADETVTTICPHCGYKHKQNVRGWYRGHKRIGGKLWDMIERIDECPQCGGWTGAFQIECTPQTALVAANKEQSMQQTIEAVVKSGARVTITRETILIEPGYAMQNWPIQATVVDGEVISQSNGS